MRTIVYGAGVNELTAGEVEKFRQFYGCDRVVKTWKGATKPADGALVLTDLRPDEFETHGVDMFPLAEAWRDLERIG